MTIINVAEQSGKVDIMSRKPAAKSGRTGWRICVVLLCAAICTPLIPSQTFAQEQRRTLFEMLFGRPVGREDAPTREYRPRSRRDFPAAPRERSVTRPQPARKTP
ncbi:lipoprotein, partial [Rhizobium nepotum 39/7]